ncbi:MAG TPA: S-layer homology domain-containing protein, partial [Chloroflexia bacterium]|nr:S-layer homology domain-containing protein [Chloroflexia bacterium]
CRGIVSGYSNGKFRPEVNVTRGQASKIVSNSAGFDEPPVGQTYEDVPPDHTFYPFIERLSSRGLISGYPCGGPSEQCGPGNRPYFRPGADASRGQISKIVANAAGYNEPPGEQTFEDVPTEHTFYPHIERLSSRGVVNGYPCGGSREPCGPGNRPYFRPGNAVTRGQISKMAATTFFPECVP